MRRARLRRITTITWIMMIPRIRRLSMPRRLRIIRRHTRTAARRITVTGRLQLSGRTRVLGIMLTGTIPTTAANSWAGLKRTVANLLRMIRIGRLSAAQLTRVLLRMLRLASLRLFRRCLRVRLRRRNRIGIRTTISLRMVRQLRRAMISF